VSTRETINKFTVEMLVGIVSNLEQAVATFHETPTSTNGSLNNKAPKYALLKCSDMSTVRNVVDPESAAANSMTAIRTR
jgi:hypothetical protein